MLTTVGQYFVWAELPIVLLANYSVGFSLKDEPQDGNLPDLTSQENSQ